MEIQVINMRIYTDGSCRANGNGGIGVVWIRNKKKVQEYSKKFQNVTNNMMELKAIEVALKSIKKPINSLEIISDSEYSIGVITNPKWIPKKNLNLITNIKNLLNEKQKLVKHPIKFFHVKGHSGNEFNELCDKLATNASSSL